MTVVLAVGPAAANHWPNNEMLLGVDRPCIRVSGYERAQATGRPETLRVYTPPPHRPLRGRSSRINDFLDRDSRPRS